MPFVCVRDIDSALGEPILQGLGIACSALGADLFVDVYDLKVKFGVAEADERFRKALLSFLTR